ncbi:MAG TPA: M48 family metalloprotease [Bryobacteraceae bacterium]|nr:M48 family metalloprotease [Bryobacteraceae bacterium]
MKLSPITALAVICAAAAPAYGQDPAALSKLFERVLQRERAFVKDIRTRTPLLETYIQETGEPADTEARPNRDHYFLGRLGLTDGVKYTAIATSSEVSSGSRLLMFKKRSLTFSPSGFAQMIFIDGDGFTLDNYSFDYVRREFLGDVRTIVFDAAPLDKNAAGGFIGRIWVDDRDLNVVRFNGTYIRSTSSHLYFHFDSWRVCVAPGQWMPALIYVEENASPDKGGPTVSFKAQSRLWGYNTGRAARMDELTNLLVELDAPVRDKAEPSDVSPLESQHSWELQAEENILGRLEKSGMIAGKGPVDQVLDTVVNNLIVTNNLNVEAHCRVLLTTPLETFTVGRTIVISRGLIDVLPDEASLAMVLSDELAHIALGHRTNTQFAFHNQTMFSDEDLMQKFRFSRTPQEIAGAGRKAVEFLRNSPYKDKLSNAGLFLKALASRAPRYPNLIRANIGNQLASGDTIVRMGELAVGAPTLEDARLEQIAALPLGSRVKLDPWTSNISLIKTKAISLLSAREKLLFEITPFAPHLTRGVPNAAEIK